MTGEYPLLQRDNFQVDGTYFADLRKPVRGHEKSPMEQRIHEARLSESDQQALRRISAEYVISRAGLAPGELAEQRTSLLEVLTSDLPDYQAVGSAGLSRDVDERNVTLVLGGQRLELDELEVAYLAIQPSRELLDLRQAETRDGAEGFMDRTHPDPSDPMHYLANPQVMPAFIRDEAHPGEGVVEWHVDDCLEPTYPEQLHTGLAREFGKRVLQVAGISYRVGIRAASLLIK